MAARRLLSEAELRAAVAGLSGWVVEGGRRLRKVVQMSSFLQAIELVNRVARVAEALNHHPDMLIQYRRVTFDLSTHDLGGISNLDVELARRIDEAAGTLQA